MLDKRLKDRALHRAKILRGQFDGLIKAIDAETYCVDLLMQSRSIQEGLKSLDAFLLENHLRTHVKNQMRSESGNEKAIKELVRVYTLSNK